MSMTVPTTWIKRPRLIQSFTQQVTQIFSPVQQGKHQRMSRDGRIATGSDGHNSLRNIPDKTVYEIIKTLPSGKRLHNYGKIHHF